MTTTETTGAIKARLLGLADDCLEKAEGCLQNFEELPLAAQLVSAAAQAVMASETRGDDDEAAAKIDDLEGANTALSTANARLSAELAEAKAGWDFANQTAQNGVKIIADLEAELDEARRELGVAREDALLGAEAMLLCVSKDSKSAANARAIIARHLGGVSPGAKEGEKSDV